MTFAASIELTEERPAKNRQNTAVRATVVRRLRICWSRCDSRRLTEPGRRRRYQNPLFPGGGEPM